MMGLETSLSSTPDLLIRLLEIGDCTYLPQHLFVPLHICELLVFGALIPVLMCCCTLIGQVHTQVECKPHLEVHFGSSEVVAFLR